MSKMTSKTKRILAMCLAIIMAFSVMGISTGAEGENTPTKHVINEFYVFDGTPVGTSVIVTGYTILRVDEEYSVKTDDTGVPQDILMGITYTLDPFNKNLTGNIVTIAEEVRTLTKENDYKAFYSEWKQAEAGTADQKTKFYKEWYRPVLGIGLRRSDSPKKDGYVYFGEDKYTSIVYGKDKEPEKVKVDNKLTGVEIPTCVKKIENNTFAGCNSLEEVKYLGTCKQWLEVENHEAFGFVLPVEKLDEDGNPVLDEKGNTVYEVDEEGNTNYVPNYDRAANIELVIVDQTGHVYDEWYEQLDETDKQYKTHHNLLCDVCGKGAQKEAHEFVAISNEELKEIYGVDSTTPQNADSTTPQNADATCGADGVQYKKCTKCGFVDSDKLVATGAHKYGEWQVIADENSTEEHDTAKQHYRVCEICRKTEYADHRIIYPANPADGIEHTYPDEGFCMVYGVPFCANCAKQLPDLQRTPSAHVWGEWEDNGDTKFFRSGTQTRKCKTCGDTQTRSYKQIAYTDANGDGKITDEDVTPFTKAFGNCYFGKIFGLPLGAVFFVANLVISGTETVGNWFVDMPSIVDFMKKIFH